MIPRQSIALQLYSVRHELAQDFSRTMHRIAGYGYTAVEMARFPMSVSEEAARALMDDLEITVVGAHSPLPMGVDKNAVLDNVLALNTPYLISPGLNKGAYFNDLDGIKVACEILNEANAVVKENGLTLGYHNYWFEMKMVEGKLAYQHMLDYLEPDIVFELDAYWAKVGGLDPLKVMADLKDRSPLLHIKDGSAEDNIAPMVALGEGAMEIERILEASTSKWHIVEIDHSDTDMMEVVKKSYSYLLEHSS